MATIPIFSPLGGNATRKYTLSSGALGATLMPTFTSADGNTLAIESLLLFSPTANTSPIFVSFGDSSVTTSIPTASVSGGIELAPGAYLLLNDVFGNYFNAIATTGTPTLNITYGVGQ